MRFKKIIRMFETGNVCITGLRGTGKDLLMGNVIARRNEEYISNLFYCGGYNKLNLLDWDINNTYTNFISGDVNKYVAPHLNKDIYISDAGVYFPSQYCNKLNNQYEGFVYYQALSRQVSHNNIHINVQNLNRCWDKIREQSDLYIRCNKCIYIPKIDIVIQLITIYELYNTCLQRMREPKIRLPLFANKEMKMHYKMYLDQFRNTHGKIQDCILIYKNKSKHDTYYFEKLLRKEI